MRFSVIVPTYQRRELVLACVDSLVKQILTEEFEIIVVVDGSTDDSADALRSLKSVVPLTVIEQPNRGLSAARNAGAAVARGELLLFLDDDMEADSRLLAEHDREHRNRIALVVGHIPVHPDSPPGFLSEAVGNWANERRDRLSSCDVSLLWQDWVMGQASIPRKLFCELQGFDDAFTRKGSYGNEDLEFCYRVHRKGVPIVFNPNAVSWQKYIVSPEAHLRQWYESGAADVQFARKHPELAGEIFGRGISRPPLSQVAYGPVRWLTLALLQNFSRHRSVQRLFFTLRALAYAQGVEAAGGMPRPRPLQILCYHAIADLCAGVMQPYGVGPDRFRRQLRALQKHGYHFVTVAEFLRFLNDGTGLPKRALLLTFDDCYQDLFDAGLPILQELGVPAVAFAVSGKLGVSNDWDAHLGAPVLALADAAALKELECSGIAIAAHSCTHRNLTSCSDEALYREVNQSPEDLRSNGLEPAGLFAYPYGEHDQRVRNAVQIAGFDAAMTTEPGIVTPRRNRYRLPRLEVMAGDSILGLRFRLFRDRFRETLMTRFRGTSNTAPRVSVIVPAFNAEATLAATLASIQAQTFPEWEALVIDDGSTDATGQIAHAWCDRDSRFRLLERENGGEAAARNTGIGSALTDWLVFLDSDDWIAPEYLERMFETLAANRLLDAVVCGCARVTPAGVFTEPATYGPFDLRDPFPKFVRDCPLAIHNCMIKRSVAAEIGGFDESLKTCADWDFWQRAARKGIRLGTIPDVLALYRIRPGSSSTNASRVLADGFTVIKRGYAKDPRVRQACASQYSDGLQSDDLGEALYRHALWPASMKIAGGQDPGCVLDSLAGSNAPALDPKVVGGELFHDIPLAAGETLGVWPARFGSLEKHVDDFLGRLETTSGAAGLAKAARLDLERRILESAEFDTQRALGTSHGTRIELTQPIAAIHPNRGTKQIVLVVTERNRLVGSVAIPADRTPLNADAITDAVVTHLAWPIMKNHLGLQFPPESPPARDFHALAQESRTLPRLCKLVRFGYSLLQWQRAHGVMRNRAILKDATRMLLELQPLSLAWRLYKSPPQQRIMLGKAALTSASQQQVLRQFSALAVR